MIKTKEDLITYLYEDKKANNMLCPWIKYRIKLICGSESANVMHWLRHFRKWEYHANNKGFFHKLARQYFEIRTKQIGSRLGIRAEINHIGYGLRIYHLAGGGGVYLSARKIGNNCGFSAGTTIGIKEHIDNRPLIGDNVVFGPGAKAFGKIEIGSNSFIAPNAVVNSDFPENSIVGGVPAKLIKSKFNITNQLQTND